MQSLSDRTFQDIADLMYASIGLSFPASKKHLISARLAPRIQRLGLDSFDEYFSLIADDRDSGEFQSAVDLLTTNETYFFREPAHFDLLEKMLSRDRPSDVSVWSAASSFGDEAYSCAMLLADLVQSGRISTWSVLGTDISDRVLRGAASGVFSAERLRTVSRDRLKRYCLRGEGDSDGLIRVQEPLREHVRFGQLNLCGRVEGIGPFDVVFLRNVLIYFDVPTKRAVMDKVLGLLRPGGLLFIGTAEGRVPCSTPLTSLAPGAFRKAAAA
jgi:chemotaxis protein methyltransferase CheR